MSLVWQPMFHFQTHSARNRIESVLKPLSFRKLGVWNSKHRFQVHCDFKLHTHILDLMHCLDFKRLTHCWGADPSFPANGQLNRDDLDWDECRCPNTSGSLQDKHQAVSQELANTRPSVFTWKLPEEISWVVRERTGCVCVLHETESAGTNAAAPGLIKPAIPGLTGTNMFSSEAAFTAGSFSCF